MICTITAANAAISTIAVNSDKAAALNNGSTRSHIFHRSLMFALAQRTRLRGHLLPDPSTGLTRGRPEMDGDSQQKTNLKASWWVATILPLSIILMFGVMILIALLHS